MAVVGDLSLTFSGKETICAFKKGMFGFPISSRRVSFSAGKLQNCRVNTGVYAVMQVGVESTEISKDLEKFEGVLGLDVVSEEELKERGFLGLRKTKLVCTIGPACCSSDDLEKLALGGMNVARLNMCHNTREWHQDVIRKIKNLNEEKGFSVSVMIDTEGSQIQIVDHGAPSSVKAEVIKLSHFSGNNFYVFVILYSIEPNHIVHLSP